MKKRLISLVLMTSVMLTSCVKVTEMSEETEAVSESVTEEESTTESTEATTQWSRASTYPTQEDVLSMFRYLNAGDTFTFGEYNDEEIEWVVLDISGYICYCIAADNVATMAYDEGGSSEEWNDTSLCHWLNEDFYEEAFTDEEKVRIRYALGTDYPEVSSDYKIYLLNRIDADAYSDILSDHHASDEWWLRSSSNSVDDRADYGLCAGSISYDGASCTAQNGVRPCMKLYIGTDEDRLDLADLTPTPTPTPTPEPTSVPSEEPTAAVIPSESVYDDSISEEANLEAYYTNNIAGLYGTSPSVPASIEVDTITYPLEAWLDKPGALAHSIADFDGDGDLEMISFVFVAELDEEEIENSDVVFYRLHLILCDDVDGTIRMIQDLPVESWNIDRDGEYQSSLYSEHTGFSNTWYMEGNISIYQINRDGKPCILMTEEIGGYPVGDGFAEAAYIWEVSDDTIMCASSYTAMPGSDDTRADEITFENGEPVSGATYYMYPDSYNAPGMYQGVGYYLDRHELANGYYEDHYGTQVTDPEATLIADVSIVPVMEVEGQYSGPWTINYEVQVGVG